MDSGNGGDFFSTYIHFLKQDRQLKLTKWNEERINFHEASENDRKIITQELKQIDFNHPLDSVDKLYQQEKYTQSLFFNEFDIKEDITSEGIIGKIVDKCEKMGRIKTILDFLLNFILEKNFILISKLFYYILILLYKITMYFNSVTSMKNIDSYHLSIQASLNFTRIFKDKVTRIRKSNIQNSTKFMMNKQKYQNLIKIHELAKQKLNKFSEDLLEIKSLKKKNRYSELFHKLQGFKKEIEKCNESLGSGKLVILSSFNEKCDNLLLDLTNECSILFSNLFLTKKEEKYQQLFLFYYLQGDYLEVKVIDYYIDNFIIIINQYMTIIYLNRDLKWFLIIISIWL